MKPKQNIHLEKNERNAVGETPVQEKQNKSSCISCNWGSYKKLELHF